MPVERNPDYIHFIGRHFVALAFRIHRPGTTGVGEYGCASGFVLSVDNDWFLITAGHVLADIEKAKKQGCKFSNWNLDDTFALSEKRRIYVDGPGAPETIPFDFDNEWKIFYFDEDEGTDYAFIYLPPYYVSLLTANGVQPFEEEHWNVIGVDIVADRVELVGIPNDQITELNPNGLVQKTLVALPVSRVDDSPQFSKFPQLLYGYTPDVSQSGLDGFNHIAGMSGGPIIGFWKQPDDSEKLRILALQSRWDSSSNTIIAYPTQKVGEHLKDFIAAVKQEWLRVQKTEDTEEIR